jgi:hypothetical protein
VLDPVAAQRHRLRCLPGGPTTAIAAPGDVDGDGRADVAYAPGPERDEVEDPVEPTWVDVYAVSPRVRRLARLRGGRSIGRALAGAGDVDGDRRGDVALDAGGDVLVVTARRMR